MKTLTSIAAIFAVASPAFAHSGLHVYPHGTEAVVGLSAALALIALATYLKRG